MKQLRIGLLGAPGTNKSEICDRVAASVAFLEDQSDFSILPNPGVMLQKRDVAVGAFGSYREDIWAFFQQLEQEQFAGASAQSFISNGTALGNLAHAVANLETLQVSLQTDLIQAEVMARQTTLAVLTMLAIENARYNFVFWVPWYEEQPEGMLDFDFHYGGKVHKALFQVLDQLNLLRSAPVLKAGTPKDQAQEIVDTIKNLYDQVPDIPDIPDISDVADGSTTPNTQSQP